MADDDWLVVARQLRDDAEEISRRADNLAANMRKLLGDLGDDTGLSGDREPRTPLPSTLPTGVAALDVLDVMDLERRIVTKQQE